MKKVLELGEYYVSDFIKSTADLEGRKKYSLDLYLDEQLGAVRLKDLAPPETMWGQYWYRSGINASMTKELQGIVNEITSRVKLNTGDKWLDIACNDGTLLKFVPDNLQKYGIDPCNDSYYSESSKVATVVQDYFSYEAWTKAGNGAKTAKVITCIAMFYDLDDPRPFVNDLYKVLDDNGTLVLQMSYTPLMVKQMAFDNICHEHVYYYDLTSIKTLFENHGFKIVDCSLNDTNGGSFRIYLQKNIADKTSFGTAPLRDVCDVRIASILEYEKNICNIRDVKVWEDFNYRLQALRTQVVEFVKQAKQQGKKIYGYGASTKGNTLLQHFGLDHTYIDAIAERSPYKFGLMTIGTNIPIVDEETMRKDNPEYSLVLPWHFIDEFEKREQEYLKSGGVLILPCPQFKIITA
jgi:NDP-4-keto-2,6-dideoxyhexose 3-C-methyltransferase